MGWGGKRKEICIFTLILSVLNAKLLDLGFHLGDFLALASAQSLCSNSALGLFIAYHLSSSLTKGTGSLSFDNPDQR